MVAPMPDSAVPEAGGRVGRAHVITVSDRSHSGERPDTSGPVAVAALVAAGFETTVEVIPDGESAVSDALAAAVASGAELVVTSGGTGVGPRDRTPEGTRAVIDREIPGIAELLRLRGIEASPHAVLTRGVAGIVDGRTLIVNLPGSPKAVREGIEVLLPLVPHLIDQLKGGDH